MSENEVVINEPEELSREVILLEVGALLKSERKKRDFSIDSVANALNLRKVYLQALENGDWEKMPGEVYGLGFLRQYAAYLHLDLDDTLKKLKSGHYQLTKPLTFPDPPVAPKKSWMIIAALAFILLFVGLNIFNHTPAPLPSELMQNSAIQMKQVSKNKSSHDEESIKPSKEQSVMSPSATSLESHKTDALKATLKDNKKAKIEVSDIKKMLSYDYTLTAVTADVWLQLHDSNEPPALIREVLLKKGESMKVTYSEPLRLTSGNALSLKISLNNQSIVHVNQLGKKGKVLRNHLLQITKTLP